MFLTPPNSKRRYYQVVYFIGKKRTKISTGTTDKEKAEEFFKNFVPQPRQPKQKPVITIKKEPIKFSHFADEYKEYVSNNYSAKYLKKIVAPSLRVFQSYLTDIPLENVSTRNVDQFISSTAANSKFTASLYYRTLKAAFNKAVIWNYIKENPFSKVKPPRVKKSFPAFINFNELEMINSSTEKKFLRVLFTTAFFTGMRLAELVNMKWSWIDFQKK